MFALTGMEGKMFHPLAYTKSFALIGVSILAITLVPAIIPWMLRGRIRHESESWLVRRVIEIYRPVLNFVMDHPWPVVWTVAVICILGSIPIGSQAIFLVALTMALAMAAWASWGEETSFRKHWKAVTFLWFVVVAIPVAIGISRGWTPTWLPETLAAYRWRFASAALVTTVLLSGMAVWLLAQLRYAATVTMIGSLMLVALVGKQSMIPLGREFMPPLNEGSILDMPVTIPRASVTEVAADLKVRNAEIRSFPEIESVVGKAGRAETPTDPAPLDMVETVVNLRPHEFWPKRELRYVDAIKQTQRIIDAIRSPIASCPHTLTAGGEGPDDVVSANDNTTINNVTMHALEHFDATMRSIVLQEQILHEQQLGPKLVEAAVDETLELLRANGFVSGPVTDAFVPRTSAKPFGEQLVQSPNISTVKRITSLVRQHLVDSKLANANVDSTLVLTNTVTKSIRGIAELLGIKRVGFDDIVLERVIRVCGEQNAKFVKELNWRLIDSAASLYTNLVIDNLRIADASGTALAASSEIALPAASVQLLKDEFASELLLWQKDKNSLLNELDSVVRMPGWGNIWTQPIINRIDMLATGVNTMLGVRVFGDDINKISKKCEEIAAVLKRLRGAVDVSADQVVGEGYLEIDIDRERAARFGINIGDIQDVIETALGGRVITMTVEGRERFPVRIRYARAFREDELSVKNLLVASSVSGMALAKSSATGGNQMSQAAVSAVSLAPMQIPLSQVADIRIVSGPSMIRSENGLLRSYVRLNVRDRDVIGFVEEARQAVASEVPMPEGMYIEWTGQFEHEVRARRTLSIIIPFVVLTIFVLLFFVYHDLADTLIVMCLTVPGAIFGGVLFQYLFGYNFSVAVWVGFIACFGLATESGLVILVYLREAVERRGDLENLTLEQLRAAVMEGAVHRLRPKLMTELTTMIGLAPMLWATGTGSEIMQPMAAPVLGGILVADEVIDLLLPVLFYRVRAYRWRKIHDRASAIELPNN